VARWKAFEWTTNILTICVVLWACVRLISPSSHERPLAPGPEKGTYIAINGVDWGANKATLVMALSVGCHWCAESASFYRDLLRGREPNSPKAIAVLPQAVDASSAYLHSMGIEVIAVKQSDLSKIGVSGTPTLILVDSDGKIQQSWSGWVPPASQGEIFAAMRSSPSRAAGRSTDAAAPKIPRSNALLNSNGLAALLRTEDSIAIVDVRNRKKFRTGHIANAIDIPIDELEARAPHEIPKWLHVAVYCKYCGECEASKARSGVLTACTFPMLLLHDLGYENVSLIIDDLPQVTKAGVPIESS
jgi:hypothetical protein